MIANGRTLSNNKVCILKSQILEEIIGAIITEQDPISAKKATILERTARDIPVNSFLRGKNFKYVSNFCKKII